MRLRTRIALGVVLLGCLTVTLAQRRGGRFSDEEEDAPMPADAADKTEWAFARLRYPSGRFWGYRGYWTIDYPKADRQFVQGVRRLTRLSAKSVEEIVDLDSDKIFDFPWVYAVEVGHWSLNDQQAKKMREFLDRGGFLMTDDFHGTEEWEVFMESFKEIFPDRPLVEIDNGDAIFHVLYDLEEKIQVPGIVNRPYFRTYERDGFTPHWRGVYDQKGRIQAGICFNQDNGDAWEWADDPSYPEKFASQAYKVGINYIVYAMTH